MYNAELFYTENFMVLGKNKHSPLQTIPLSAWIKLVVKHNIMSNEAKHKSEVQTAS